MPFCLGKGRTVAQLTASPQIGHGKATDRLDSRVWTQMADQTGDKEVL